ncbi:MAG: hypothetical protein JRF33_17280 [Deltaproteobacteria bacterium]|nr:hypothetical protein [Deltaproteobacteria bacterium]
MEIDFLFAIAAFVIFIVGLVIFFNEDARIKRALRKVPKLSIGDFTDGAEARLVGEVRLLDEFFSPLSKRPCAHYHLKVEQNKRSGRSSRWVTIIEDTRTVDFIIDDGTGRAIVETGQSKVAVVKDSHARSGTFNDASFDLEELLMHYGKTSTGLLGFNKSIRYHEGVIEAGEKVAVFGRGRWIKDASGKRQLVINKPAESMVLISDDPSTVG